LLKPRRDRSREFRHPNPSVAPAMNELSVREVHEKWDWDKDGAISKEDLLQSLATLDMDMAVEAVDAVFAHMDGKELGCISYDDFANWLFCRALLPEKLLLQECACSDGHALDPFLPDVDGWCCEECSADLEVSKLALKCQECSGLSFCIECTLQHSDVEAVERLAIAAVSAIAESQDTAESQETAQTCYPTDSDAASPDEDSHEGEAEDIDLVADEPESEAPKEGPVELLIVGLAGDLCRTVADYGWTVLQLKNSIEFQTGIPAIGFSLIYDLVALQDHTVLGSVQIPNGAEVMLLRRSEQQVECLQKIQKAKSLCEARNGSLPFSLLISAPDELRADRLIVLEAISVNAMDLQYASQDLQADKDIVFAATKRHPHALQHASPLLLANHEFGLELVKSNGLFLQALAENLRADSAVVLAAVNDNGMALRYAADEILEGHPEVLDLAFQRGFCLRKVQGDPRRLNDRIDVVRASVRWEKESFQYASSRLRSDRDMLMWLLLDDPCNLRFVPVELLADPQLLAIAFENDGFTLLHAPEKLRAHPDVVYRVVQQNGIELMHATSKLRSNRSIVAAAVKNCGMALQYAAIHLRNDRGIVDLAARQDTRALKFAGPNVKNASGSLI